ncbi:MAG: hypothetical protein DRP45_10580 [Candidatus Zixiibacteriota bacterium]|nr:MAG: hypothetical protein DRP45_10580 [candidate division Zixibacteria bacterium]
MAYAGGAATGAAVAAAAIANAAKAAGGIIKMDPEEFIKILNRADKPLVAFAVGGVFSKNYQYITNYRGLFFFCKADNPIQLPGSAEIINCKKIWIPA